MTDWDDVLGDGCVRHGDDFINAEEALADAALMKGGNPVSRCLICHFEQLEDDIAILSTSGRSCLCVACWNRVCETEHPMGKELRQELSRTLTQAPT